MLNEARENNRDNDAEHMGKNCQLPKSPRLQLLVDRCRKCKV